MKILFYTQLWKRPELTELVFRQIRTIKKKGYEIVVFAVISEEEMIPLCEKYGVEYVMTENLPLGRKHNTGLEAALKLDWEYCLNFGSDDLVSSKLFDIYDPYFQSGEDFFGLNDVWFYDVYSGNLSHYFYQKTYAAFGAGRVVSRRMIEKIKGKGRLVFWEDEKNKGLDSSSREIAVRNGYENLIIRTDEPVIVDVKTDVNIWGYDNYRGNEKNFEELRGFFNKKILKDLIELKAKLKPKIEKTMSVTKIYENSRYTYKRYKMGEHVIEFSGGFELGDGNRSPAKFTTTDEEIQKKIESHPEYGKIIFLRREMDADEPLEEEVKEQVFEDVTTVSAAKLRLKEVFPEVKATDLQNMNTIKEFCTNNKVKFPKLIKEE